MGEVKGPLQTAVELGKGCPLYGRDRLLTFYSTTIIIVMVSIGPAQALA